MFRYSAGTDTHIQAYVATDSSHRTVVDTGVAIKLSALRYPSSGERIVSIQGQWRDGSNN
jgi:hypothetical protein